MKRGEVWQVDLGAKAGKRPALILTRGDVIPYLNKLTVAEITTQKKGYPTEVDIDQKANLPLPSVVQLDNIQTIPKSRFIKFIGMLDKTDMKLINEKIIFALDLIETT
ncbi:MAG: type II toxin-antitoxin system PemK/MazF family toxin [Calditrichaceae bacterium]|nr:type II toxin-antitoxin system PemK/MazF family toxin [Calditrichia bacterium]NUQ43053.1 type II toxin-antitoxin system PemK/MazF family toxin [Calditrichaceae bacterium]